MTKILPTHGSEFADCPSGKPSLSTHQGGACMWPLPTVLTLATSMEPRSALLTHPQHLGRAGSKGTTHTMYDCKKFRAGQGRLQAATHERPSSQVAES